jgi:hypothetical protein
LVEETGVPGENHRPAASHWQTLSHNVNEYTSLWAWKKYKKEICPSSHAEFQIQWNRSKPKVRGTRFCTQNTQVFDFYMLN